MVGSSIGRAPGRRSEGCRFESCPTTNRSSKSSESEVTILRNLIAVVYIIRYARSWIR